MIELFIFKRGDEYGSLRLLSRYTYVKECGHIFGESINDKKGSLYLQFDVMNSSNFIELPKKKIQNQQHSDYKRYNAFLGECINYLSTKEDDDEDNNDELIIIKKMWSTFEEAVKDFHVERYGKTKV